MLGKLMAGSLLAASLLLPAQAMAAEHLDCVATGYSADAQQRIDNYVRTYRAGVESDDSVMAGLLNDAAVRMGDCADEHDWSQSASESALYYRMFDLLKQALLANSPLTSAQIVRLDRALASPEGGPGREVLRSQLLRSISGQATGETSDAEALALGRMALRAGVPLTGPSGDFVGEYLAAAVAIDHYSAQFSGQ